MTQQPGVADLLVRCLEREGATVVFGIPGEENIGFVDALARSPVRYVLVRHEQAASFMAEIYGRAHRPRRGVLGDAGPGRDQPAARHGRCHDEQLAGGGLVGAGRPEPDLQGVPPERRSGIDVLAGDQVGGRGPDPGRGAGDDPQGVQAGADRTSRRGLPGRARGRRGHERAGAGSAQPQHPPARRAVGSADRAGRGGAGRRPAAGRAGWSRGRPGAGGGRPAALLRAAGPAGGDHLPRQGRVPRRPSQCARRGGVHAA